MTDELKPCPFCGGPARLWTPTMRNYPDMARYQREPACDQCGVAMGFFTDADKATDAWNTRADGWQPIETAPKDGTEVLGWREDCGAMLMRWTSLGEFLTESELAEYDEATTYKEDWFYADFVAGGRLESDEAPTHWRPLPAGPQVAS